LNDPGERTVRSPRARFASILLLSSGLLAADLALRLQASSNADPGKWSLLDVGVYAIGVLWSLLTWVIFASLASRLLSARPRALQALLTSAALTCGVVFMISFFYRLYFFQSPSWQVIKFAIAEPRNVFQIALWALSYWHLAVFCALTGLIWAALRRSAGSAVAGGAPRVRLQLALPIGVLYLASSVFTLAIPGFQDPLPVEANTGAAFAQYLLATAAGDMHLVAPVRPTIPPQPEVDRPSVLLLIHESLRADAQLPDLDYSQKLDARAVSPFSSRLPERGAEGYIVFPRGRCNSTATESSVPTILSGLDLGGETSAYGQAHTVWSLGKATGAATFLFSAQSYSWSHFDEYFFDQNLDVVRTGLNFAPAYVNDVGVDDALAVDAALAEMQRLSAERRRFVGVIHFSATHAPGFPGPGVQPDPDGVARYRQAAHYIDTLVERIERGLDAAGLSETTVVVSTADHGEPLDSPHRVGRLGSFYEETIRVPYWIRLPPAVAVRNPGWREALLSWRTRNVQNMDLLPTIRDFLRMTEDPSVGKAHLPGRSLLRPPVDEPDLVTGQSTCAFRTWTQEGLFLIRGDTKLLLSNERSTPEVFDLTVDPAEQNNLWQTEGVAEQVLPWAREKILEGPERRAACKRAGAVCVLDPRAD
jgi:glucan phosphoethanolaminetransferase (alkaline phosphatase superfamily)